MHRRDGSVGGVTGGEAEGSVGLGVKQIWV